MLLNEESGDTSEELTADTAAPAFEAFLSSEDEDQTEPESPPTQEAPASESNDAEASTEQAQAEDASETANESTEEAAEEAPQPEAVLDPNLKVKVRIDGQETEVTLEEALKGYSRTSDYTRKTQELATQRKAQESEFAAVKGERQMYAQRLAQVEKMMLDLTPQEPDWEEVQSKSPDQFPVLWAQWSAHKQKLQAVHAEREAAEAAVQRDNEANRQEYLRAEQSKLEEALPDMKDPEKAKATKAAMVGYVKNLGYSTEDIGRITDHRLIVLIDKAMKFDEMQAKKPIIATKIAEKIKTATPGAQQNRAPSSKAQKARERLARSGSVDDAAEAMEAFLD